MTRLAGPLSFGVEFEFCLLTVSKGIADPHPNDPRIVRDIDEVAEDKDSRPTSSGSNASFASNAFDEGSDGLSAAQDHLARTLRHSGFQVLTDSEIADRNISHERQIQCWVVSSDPTIKRSAELHQNYNIQQIEIKSPAFLFNTYSLQAIRNFCSLISSTYRFECPNSCGLHVHVGPGGNSPFTHDPIKNFTGFLWAFERQISSIHASHRLTDSVWCLNMTEATKLAGANLTDLQKLQVIFNSPSLDALKAALNVQGNMSKFSAVNLDHLLDRAGFGTVELRQHQASLDPEDVANWVSVCVGLMAFAHRISPQELKGLLSTCITSGTDSKISLPEILRYIGLEKQATYYQKVI